MGAEDTGDKLTLSQAGTLNQDHVITIAIFVVSLQTLTSCIRQSNADITIKISTTLPIKYILLCRGKGLTLHKGSANEPISALLCAGFEHAKYIITI